MLEFVSCDKVDTFLKCFFLFKDTLLLTND